MPSSGSSPCSRSGSSSGSGFGLTFFADEWAVIADRTVTAKDLLAPFNEHWLAVTIVVYRGLLGLVGMGSYVPYLALLAVMHATVAVLVYALVRRRTLPAVAVGIALVVLLFGSGFENLFWGIQIGFVGATALGLGALLLLDDVPTLPGRGRALAATGLMVVAVMTSGYGLFMLGLVGLDVLLDGRRRRWVLLLAIPAALYGLWYVTLGRSGIATYGNPFTPETLAALPRFIVDGMATALGAAVGGGALLGRILTVALVGWIAWLAVKRRPIPTRAIACLLAIVAEYTIVGIVRAQLEVDASLYTRYAYLSGILALIALASLLGRPAIPEARRPVILAAGVAGAHLLAGLERHAPARRPGAVRRAGRPDPCLRHDRDDRPAAGGRGSGAEPRPRPRHRPSCATSSPATAHR